MYVVHGDGFAGLGYRSDLAEIYAGLRHMLVVKHRGILGPMHKRDDECVHHESRGVPSFRFQI